MTLDVGDELREFIDSLVKAVDYRTQSEVMRDALQLLREKQAESPLQELRDLLAEGISSGEAKLTVFPEDVGNGFTPQSDASAASFF